MKNRNLEFLYEVASLRNVQRGWRQHMATDCANVLEHTMRVVWLALLIARREGKTVDENKIMKMALIHDLPEARTSDLSYVQKKYATTDEVKAADDMFADTLLPDFRELLKEYDERTCLEAHIVKDADHLDIDMEMKEFEEKGHALPGKWAEYREKIIHDKKLYTESAKQMWNEIKTSEPSDWHMNSNKYEGWRKEL